MKNISILISMCMMCCFTITNLQAQTQDCTTSGIVDPDSITGTVFFNYGSIAVASSSRNIGSISVGEPIVGETAKFPDFSSTLGFWSRFLLPPLPPVAQATQGDLLDRIQLSWQINALGSSPSGGFNIYRDGIFIETVGPGIRNYIDFNVIAGQPYNYTVRGINVFGEGPGDTALGFMVPNGVVTGLVQTLNGNPVPDALVALTPIQGFSLGFDEMAGAFAMADTNLVGDTSFLPVVGGDWSLTFWIKTSNAEADAAIMEFEPIPLYIQTLESAGGTEGIAIGTTSANNSAFLTAPFPTTTGNDWHHVTFTVEGATSYARIYIDGVLADIMELASSIAAAQLLSIGSRVESMGTWEGKLDELRIYHRLLNELELGEIIMGTASSLTPDLAYYWKMDEGQGIRSFDILRRNKLYFCGAEFDEDRAPVRTSGMTNEDGYYRIEGVSYGTGTTFLARPEKQFYMHRALQFNRTEEDTVLLPDFALLTNSTLEIWINNSGPVSDTAKQTILSKSWPGHKVFVYLEQNATNSAVNDLVIDHNGNKKNYGSIGMGYQHLALDIRNVAGVIHAYVNGSYLNNGQWGTEFGIWSDTSSMPNPTPWIIGANGDGTGVFENFYDGLIDELAIYDRTLNQQEIFAHVQSARDPQELGLYIYFMMDEGSNRLNSTGSLIIPPGTVYGAEWSPFAANQETMPHEFSPATRQVTLNPSVTSVDQVDFSDRSTVSVSGFVRYANTDCFAENVEILVDDQSYSPRIFTDSTGKFLIDLDPGASAELTPVLADHEFAPTSKFIINVVTPIAGLLFNDMTTRTISGQVAGGSKVTCKKSITNANGTDDCIITVRTPDGCYERTMEVIGPDGDGTYQFDNLPPLEMTIAVSNHNNPQICTDFQTQGGRTINLTEKDSSDVDFIYIASPDIQVDGFDDWRIINCEYTGINNPIVLPQYQNLSLDIKVYEQYGPQDSFRMEDRCYLDTAEIKIINTFDQTYNPIEPILDSLQSEPSPSGAVYEYAFTVDYPTPTPPHLKQMQIIAEVDGRQGTYEQRALIEGVSIGPTLFTTKSPVFPNYVLRDPPGDGSSAFLEQQTMLCNTLTFEDSGGAGLIFANEFKVGSGVNIRIPFVGGLVKFLTSNGNTEKLESLIISSNTNSMEYCVTTNERITTDDSDLIVGGVTSFDGGETLLSGHDIYIGTAFNFTFSKSLDISFENCMLALDTIATVGTDSFATTYMYSEWNLENNVLRYLQDLVDTPPEDSIDYAAYVIDSANWVRSITNWESFIVANKTAKEKANFVRNISFDAGVQYEYSETIDTTEHSESGVAESIEGELSKTFDIEFESQGTAIESELSVGIKFQGNFLQKQEDDWTHSVTTGYTLTDDDPGDTWTVDIKKDPIFKTPVFDVIAGQTSCPWEVGTANREKPLLINPSGEFTIDDIPAKEAAVFHFLLGNESGSEEDWTYSLVAFPESNPHGAVIKVNGATLTGPRDYIVPFRDTVPITLTVERGPEAYDYMGLQIGLVSGCEYERNQALSFPVEASGTTFYSIQTFNVRFIEPCTDVDLFNPKEGWLIKQGSDTLKLTIVEYDKGDSDLRGIRPQYRPADGNGAWLNMISENLGEIPKAQLGGVFTTYDWKTGSLGDGPYEIRALAICASGDPADNPGISRIIPGYIDRQPPQLIGRPQPSDGVLQVGDEISFTFNQEINCANLNSFPSAALLDNILLFDATTGLPIEVTFGCFENKIIMTTTDAFINANYENHMLRAELHGIEDLSENVFNGTMLNRGIWEFYVDRNELAWLTDKVEITKYEDESKAVIAKIHNRGGYPVPFSIRDVPEWAHVVPDTGTIVANEIRDIRIEIDSDVNFGMWSDSITLHTVSGIATANFFMGGDEPLPLDVRVVCRPPDWEIDPAAYSYSMNFALELDVEGELSKDNQDIVAAFVDDELRGLAYVEYASEVDSHEVFLTVFSNDFDIGTVTFRIWDASDCQLYAPTLESFPFTADSLVGSAAAPMTIHTNSLLLRNVGIHPGWNWLSFNLQFPDPMLNPALSSLHQQENDLIKSQTEFANYYGDPVYSWVGSLDTLDNVSMFQYRASVGQTMNMIGHRIDPTTVPISVTAGWNWIGYLPENVQSTNDALASLAPTQGDIIKSQTEFAEYIQGVGWVGSLEMMEAPNGYLLRLANAGTLDYPANFKGSIHIDVQHRDPNRLSPWLVDATQFEHTMILIGFLHHNDLDISSGDQTIGAFVKDQIRGVAKSIYIEQLDRWLFFLTLYANKPGELVEFKLYDEDQETTVELNEQLAFSINGQEGSVESPSPFTWNEISTDIAEIDQEDEARLLVQPNPFRHRTRINFFSKGEAATLIITNLHGQVVEKANFEPNIGWLSYEWNSTDLPSGIYMVQVKTGTNRFRSKIIAH